MARDRTANAMARMAKEDPELAARLVLMTLPAAAKRIPGRLEYRLEVEGLGQHRVLVSDGQAAVEPEGMDGRPDPDFAIRTDAAGLAGLASGTAPLRLMLTRRLRIVGSKRKATRLRAMAGDPPGMGEVVEAGGRLDPDLLYRALPYLIDPEWTRGHRFTVCYEVEGDKGGRWYVEVRDGERLRVGTESPPGGADGTARVGFDAYQRMAAGKLTPAQAMQDRLTEVDGEIYPVTLLGRWIDRSQGRDDRELAREEQQRAVQQARSNGLRSANGSGAGQGDPGHDAEAGRRDGAGLLGYRELYTLWERQNWKTSDLDFSVDREQWLATPTEAQQNTIWSLGSFYVGEERVTADLAPFLLAAPSGEVELFLSTQLVDEARHAAFFDRFGAEVMALSADDLRGRMREVESRLLSPWREVFDDGLRDVANRIKARPDDLDLFVEGIATYHMVVEGFLAVTGQTLIRDYMVEHGLYPGFCEGFRLVERDEHRHVAFGVRFLKEAIESDSRHAATVERTVLTLAPRAAHVFCPPYVDDPREFVSYGYHSSEIYGHAYRTLKRRMKVLGIEIPPPEELMPGPIAEPAATTAA
jgi:ribonucleoside-diphosphate reductase beta chain